MSAAGKTEEIPSPGNVDHSQQSEVNSRYARYVLFVLIVVYIFNFIDRQIISILAEEIKADLGIGDAEIGFLYGTAFAIFYAVFGIPLGKLADVWNRKSLIAIGLSFWSLMTAASGFAKSYPMLAAFRFGVGVGEASATPAAFSMLSDYFSPRVRATVLAVYSSGIYIGAGVGLFLGGAVVELWYDWYPDPSLAPLGIKPWQAAFLVVGLPGVLVAIWVWTIREPVRGLSEGLLTPQHQHPFAATRNTFFSVLPGLSLILLHSVGGMRAVFNNLVALAFITALFYGLYVLMPTPLQWVALGTGVYITVSWVQYLQLYDPGCFGMMFRSKAFVLATIGFPSISFVTYGIGFWSAPFMQRVHGESISDAGLYLGLAAALGGFIGIVSGGFLADHLKTRTANARLYIGMAVPALALPFAVGFLYTDSVLAAYLFSFGFSILSPAWIGSGASTVNDLVMPRMRATASAYYLLMNTFLGLALGPYLMGQISDLYITSGADSGESLRTAMTWGLTMFGVAILFLTLATKYLSKDESSRVERARALGEGDV